MAHDPFKSIDIQGVGSLIQLATNKCRRGNPDLQVRDLYSKCDLQGSYNHCFFIFLYYL